MFAENGRSGVAFFKLLFTRDIIASRQPWAKVQETDTGNGQALYAKKEIEKECVSE